MKKVLTTALVALMLPIATMGQENLKRIYNEDINPLEQIDSALKRAKSEGKFVACQVGGNWCPWCLRFADFITSDSAINALIKENFIYIHANYNPRKSLGAEKQEQAKLLMKRLNNPARFGFPVIVILDENGKVIHTQDSSFLEEGKGYDKNKVERFFKSWTPQATKV